MIAPMALGPAVAVMIVCSPATLAHREVAPMHVQTFGSDTHVRGTFSIQVTGLQTTGRSVVDSASHRPTQLSLEEAFAEWSDESLTMANDMWHHGATDTRDA